MIYSRFDEKDGLYDLFEDTEGRAVNSDLPVPVVGAPTNGIGAPATEVGRGIPASAKYVGRSWHARGMVAAPSDGAKALAGMSEAEGRVVPFALAALCAMGLFLYFWYNPPEEGSRRLERR